MKAKTLFESFKFALEGLGYTFETQRNFRIHSLAGAVVIATSAILSFSVPEMFAILSAVFGVLVAELLNTSIEKTIDMYTDKFHPLAKIAKNCAAGAVLLTAVYAVTIALLVYIPALLRFVR